MTSAELVLVRLAHQAALPEDSTQDVARGAFSAANEGGATR